ncbi:MAG: hypothetical protein CL678_13055 [Bdellovibrionaceae bacterium]|nr:hypothetical protein [Pseudobdellovibrionaceae bacterium]|tara:strand:+ start:602 stop:946 length:345 start_codon:yes stop_codon:yes gene_type:complete
MKTEIVFIDDEAELCEIYEQLFESEDIEIKTFTDPKEGIQYVNEASPKLVFIDYRMPDHNGIECREQMTTKSHYFLVTGELDIDPPEGFESMIKKPLSFSNFREILKKHHVNAS